MGLDRISIEGFKSIKRAEIRLGSLNILIGANGSGKSNFISLFRLLNNMVTEGLGLQLFISRNGGADSFLYHGRKITSRIHLELEFGRNKYLCDWVPSADDNLVFALERVEYLREDRFGGGWSWDDLGSGHKESHLTEESKRGYTKAHYVLEAMKSWRVFHFHDTSESASVKKTGQINDNLYLRMDGGNLAAFLLRLRYTQPNSYNAIRDTVRMVAPFFDDFILRPEGGATPDSIRLEWREKGSDFPFLAHQLSDGTLRFICLATALLQPNLPSTILIDEPELGLHPYALTVLASLMRKAALQTQLIVSTQSVPLVNEFEPGDLLVVNRKNQATVLERLDSQALDSWLEMYSLGELWEKNVIGGRPSK